MLCEDLFVGTKLDPDKQARILVDLALLGCSTEKSTCFVQHTSRQEYKKDQKLSQTAFHPILQSVLLRIQQYSLQCSLLYSILVHVSSKIYLYFIFGCNTMYAALLHLYG